MNNPFVLSFGRVPINFIPRYDFEKFKSKINICHELLTFE